MRENFLHYVWKFKKFELFQLQTTQGEALQIVSVGAHNTNAGPDFFNARIRIGNQLWAGNVEIHVKSSDWYAHHHETDAAYDSVVLHVVYEHDTDVFRADNTVIPTLELKSYIHKRIYNTYQGLLKQKTWIYCENDFGSRDDFLMEHWLERLYFERLEQKAKRVTELLKLTKNNWEATLFLMLAKNFGLKVNGDAFFSMAKHTDYAVVRKVQSHQLQLEALFFGQAGLLEDHHENDYYLELQQRYRFQRQKFQLDNANVVPIQFFRLRPISFPTIRLSQLAGLYNKEKRLFSKVMALKTPEAFYDVFQVSTTGFWNTHYTFSKPSKFKIKILTRSFIDLLLINTILPIKFCYARERGDTIDESILSIISKINSENNSVIKAFNALKHVSKSAMHSQGLIQLKNEYCDKHQCLNCAIGNSLLNQ